MYSLRPATLPFIFPLTPLFMRASMQSSSCALTAASNTLCISLWCNLDPSTKASKDATATSLSLAILSFSSLTSVSYRSLALSTSVGPASLMSGACLSLRSCSWRLPNTSISRQCLIEARQESSSTVLKSFSGPHSSFLHSVLISSAMSLFSFKALTLLALVLTESMNSPDQPNSSSFRLCEARAVRTRFRRLYLPAISKHCRCIEAG
mmetsp:Transcript_1180/g.2112  ORF Transcript_1180/g.2112 Transcript_1180/m.2112 type:complete len:208 (+) Transcript_1180:36-659(+)